MYCATFFPFILHPQDFQYIYLFSITLNPIYVYFALSKCNLESFIERIITLAIKRNGDYFILFVSFFFTNQYSIITPLKSN